MKRILLVSSAALLLLSACATQDDGDVLFSDTERAIIKTLVYKAPSGEASNQYVNNSAAATLGQKFFWDPQFSGDIFVQGNRVASFAPKTDGSSARQISCATCHVPNFGWADNTSKPNNVSLGSDLTNRNSPTVLNTSFNIYSTWSGRSDSVWGVMVPGIEGLTTQNFSRAGVAYIICRNNTSTYLAEYTAVFGAPNCADAPAAGASPFTSANNWGRSIAHNTTVNTIFANFGKAIGAYEHLLVSKNSAFDQWAEGNENAMTVSQKRGLKIFINKGNCVRCHSGPNFADGGFHNLGVPQIGGALGVLDDGRYTGISDLLTGGNSTFNTASSFNATPSVNRVSGLSRSDSDTGKFKTPTLRSVNKTPPYFHNGTFNSLWDVVNFYNFAGNAGNFAGTKDPILTTRHMTNEEMEDLVNFLKALEGEALAASLTSSPGGFGTTTNWP
jgi:cytochrome c peroxidase